MKTATKEVVAANKKWDREWKGEAWGKDSHMKEGGTLVRKSELR